MVEVAEAGRVGARLQYRLVCALIMQSLAKYYSMGVRPWTHGICHNPVECWECLAIGLLGYPNPGLVAQDRCTTSRRRHLTHSHTHTHTPYMHRLTGYMGG